jgi:hypothetical protein
MENEFQAAYAAEPEVPAIQQPAQATNVTQQAYANAGKDNGYKRKPKQFNSKNDKIVPEEIDSTSLVRFARTFSCYSDIDIPMTLLENIDKLVERLAERKFKMRSVGNSKVPLDKVIRDRYDNVELILPFKDFDGNPEGKITFPTEQAHKFACRIELDKQKSIRERKQLPYIEEECLDDYNGLRNYIKLFNARDVHILVGPECDTALNLMIVYTECGSETTSKLDYKKAGYNVSDIIKLCDKLAIPVFNLKNPDAFDRIKEFLNTFN